MRTGCAQTVPAPLLRAVKGLRSLRERIVHETTNAQSSATHSVRNLFPLHKAKGAGGIIVRENCARMWVCCFPSFPSRVDHSKPGARVAVGVGRACGWEQTPSSVGVSSERVSFKLMRPCIYQIPFRYSVHAKKTYGNIHTSSSLKPRVSCKTMDL